MLKADIVERYWTLPAPLYCRLRSEPVGVVALVLTPLRSLAVTVPHRAARSCAEPACPERSRRVERLWRRYLIGNPLFLWRVLKQRPVLSLVEGLGLLRDPEARGGGDEETRW
jgi:hypothetical protein